MQIITTSYSLDGDFVYTPDLNSLLSNSKPDECPITNCRTQGEYDMVSVSEVPPFEITLSRNYAEGYDDSFELECSYDANGAQKKVEFQVI